MRLLRGYIVRGVLTASLLVLLVLLALAGFVEMIGQLDNVGEGNFSATDAMVYTLLRLPLLAVQMVPVAALIGALLGMGALASHSELTVMRAAGVSKWQLARAVALSGVVMMGVTAVAGEFLAPPLDQFARKYRDAAKNVGSGQVSGDAVWIRDGRTFFNIERITSELDFGRVYLFEFDDERRLRSVGMALNGGLDPDDRWVLDNYVSTAFDEDGATAESEALSVRQYDIDAELLGVSIIRPTSMSLRGLSAYMRYLRANDLSADAYRAEYWNRIASTVAIVIMPMLAIGFVFGSLRSAGTGARMLIGVMIGLGWFLATRLLSNSGQVFDLNVVVTAWLPTLALAAATAAAVARVR